MRMSLSVMIVLGALFFNACQEACIENSDRGIAGLDKISQEGWDSLAQKKIFFGHMSVGNNVIDGLKGIMAKFPSVNLNIQETTNPQAFGQPIFAHAPIGTNGEPYTKIARFREIMESGVGLAADIALFKFCYADVNHTTNIDVLFRSYVELIDYLGSRFPNLKVVTVTVPLLSKPYGVKGRLKKILGRLPWLEGDNIRRNDFNDMLRARYAGSIFDLAAVESGPDDSKKTIFKSKGKEYQALSRSLTDDGVYLNLKGRQAVAAEFLRVLAEF